MWFHCFFVRVSVKVISRLPSFEFFIDIVVYVCVRLLLPSMFTPYESDMHVFKNLVVLFNKYV